MEIDASIFFTDYSMSPTDLATALEERGFDTLWVAEHSHISPAREAAWINVLIGFLAAPSILRDPQAHLSVPETSR